MTIEGIINMFKQHEIKVRDHAKVGIIYGSACVTDLDLMLDEILRRLENGEDFETFLFDMEKEGYENPILAFTEESHK